MTHRYLGFIPQTLVFSIVFSIVYIGAQEIHFDENCNSNDTHDGFTITTQDQGHNCEFYHPQKMSRSLESDIFGANMSIDDMLVLTWAPRSSYFYEIQIEGKFQPHFVVHNKTKRCLHITVNETTKHHWQSSLHEVKCIKVKSNVKGTITMFVQKIDNSGICLLKKTCDVTRKVLNYIVTTTASTPTTSTTTTSTSTTNCPSVPPTNIDPTKYLWIYASVAGAIVAAVTMVVFICKNRWRDGTYTCCFSSSRHTSQQASTNAIVYASSSSPMLASTPVSIE